jgi:hypothetical protein
MRIQDHRDPIPDPQHWPAGYSHPSSLVILVSNPNKISNGITFVLGCENQVAAARI